MLYELRTYHIVPGKKEALLDRFRDKTIGLFAKHGMRTTEFWVDADDSNNRLYYILEHPDMESRVRNYKAFQDDPDWIETRRITELNGPLVEKIEISYMHRAPFFKGK